MSEPRGQDISRALAMVCQALSMYGQHTDFLFQQILGKGGGKGGGKREAGDLEDLWVRKGSA